MFNALLAKLRSTAPEVKVRVGATYLNRRGQAVKIAGTRDKIDDSWMRGFQFRDDAGHVYRKDGKFFTRKTGEDVTDSHLDLVQRVA